MEVDTNIESSESVPDEHGTTEKEENQTIIENLGMDYAEYLEIDAKKEVRVISEFRLIQ